MSGFIDMTGQKYSRLTVISFEGYNKHRQSTWLCICECGVEKIVLGASLKTGATQSCGCLNIEKISERFTTHGHRKSKKRPSEYQVWASMIQRCTNPNVDKYKDYGGRGITVCDRWRDFENFLADMGKRTSKKHSIDRIDVNGNYELGNCKWSTRTEQVRNIRIPKRNTSGHKGVSWNKQRSKWHSRIAVNGKEIHLGLFDNIEDAIEARKQGEIKYWNKQPSK